MRNRWSGLAILVLCACNSGSALSIGGVPARTAPGDGTLGVRLARAMRAEYRAQAEKTPPPLALAPSDGSELALTSLAATVTIEGPLAHTELRMTFFNAEARQREGRFGITLPPGATVGRFAMKIAGTWRESRVVSRAKGREVYETFLHQRVDPALLERDLGNQFSARVFPIAPRESKEIILAYDHLVSEVQPYVLALEGLPPVPDVAIAIDHDGARRDLAPDGATMQDLEIPITRGPGAIGASGAFIARIDTATANAPAALERVLVLVDTSASRATVMGRQGMAVERLVAALPSTAIVTVAAFDHKVTELYRGTAGNARDLGVRLFDHGALGASDLGGALGYAANHGLDRVILVGDGAPTLGEREPTKLAAALAAIERIDAVQVGASIDRDTLAPIVRGGRTPGAILDGRNVDRVAAQLAVAVMPEARISVAGATASWPPTTRGTAPGDPLFVFGLRSGDGPLRVRIGEREVSVAAAGGTAKRIRRTVAGAELAELTERSADAPDADKAKLAKQIEKLALAHELVSTQTSLIVLETDADERRMLGPRPVEPAVLTLRPEAKGIDEIDISDQGRGEVIQIRDSAPSIDLSSTSQGITITKDYLRHIPVPGRTFEGALGTASGVGLSGSTSLENRYRVDSVSPHVRTGGPIRTNPGWMLSDRGPDFLGQSLTRESYMRHRDDPADDAAAPSAFVSRPAPPANPYAGAHTDQMLAVSNALATGDRDRALDVSTMWQLANPGDVAAVLALGEALEARGDMARAARAYGSIMDLYPNRAELLRAAGERLDRLAEARSMAIDAYRRAVAERPDQAVGYRLLAFALVRDGRLEEAREALIAGAGKTQLPAVLQVFGEDRVIVEAAMVAKDPSRSRELLGPTPPPLATKPSIRFVLTWETDANDVDLAVRDRDGNEASYRNKSLVTGGVLTADLTDGWGPEQFSILEPKAFPYELSVHYYRRGPMGFGLGTVQVIRHDGKGAITVESRPFLIQIDHARFHLGTVAAR